MTSGFKKGDVLKNRHHPNIIVRLIDGYMYVTPEGSTGTAAHHVDHWEKASYWMWFTVTCHWIVRQLFLRHCYESNKLLGLVDAMDPIAYWKKCPPVYLSVYKEEMAYGFIRNRVEVKKLQYPAWREVLNHTPYDRSIVEWISERLKHLL